MVGYSPVGHGHGRAIWLLIGAGTFGLRMGACHRARVRQRGISTEYQTAHPCWSRLQGMIIISRVIFDKICAILPTRSTSPSNFRCAVFFRVARFNSTRVRRNASWRHCFKMRPALISWYIYLSTPNNVRLDRCMILCDGCVCHLQGTRGDAVRFGLRVKVIPYPDNVCAVWVMLAVKYKPVD